MQTRSQTRQPECAVCYQRISLQGRLDKCNHFFCAGCISRWAQKENTCPLCKSRFSEINKIPTRPLYSDHARSLVGRQKITSRNQSQTNPFVELYVNALDNSHFFSNEEDINLLNFLIALDQQLDHF